MKADVVIIGGGFFGVGLALLMRSVTGNVVIVEREGDLLTQASYANQARIHTGYHYPRSFSTAKRSFALHSRFKKDFAPAVVDDFQMLYAVARKGSHVSSRRFFEMFQQIGTDIEPASPAQQALFDAGLIDAVFACREAAFDASVLRTLLRARLDAAGITLCLGQQVNEVSRAGDGLRIKTAAGEEYEAAMVFNATYSRLNHITIGAENRPLPIKNELAEIALVHPPAELAGLGVTVVDGPFFSAMPFPAQGCYSLTHVRYTPQISWTYDTAGQGRQPTKLAPRSRWLHMARDASRYMPCAADFTYKGSLFTTKSVLLRNEFDDGRPIFLRKHGEVGECYSVMGGKIDNIYDLFEELVRLGGRFAKVTPDWLVG